MAPTHAPTKTESTEQDALASSVASCIRLACSPARVQSKPWRRSLLASDDTVPCAFCLSPLQTRSPSTYLSFLVPLFLGGPRDDSNRLIACRDCANARSALDVLCWPAFARLGTPESRTALLARREQILFFSANHLTPSSRWSSKDRVNRLLLSRFKHPRIRVFAGHGFIGWTRRCGGRSALGQAAGILRFGFKASPVPGYRLTLFRVPPAQFLDALWALIEHGALVSPALLENESAPLIDLDDWRTCWPLTFCDPADIRRRRTRLAGNQVRVPGTLAHAVRSLGDRAEVEGISARRTAIPAPSPPRKQPRPPRPKPPLSSNPATMRSRERYRRKVRDQRQQAWLQARQELLDYKQRMRRGLAAAPSPEQLQVLDQAVADLYAAIDRW